MAYKATKTKETKSVFPSSFGSHSSMLDDKYTEQNESKSCIVICKDDRGSYVTNSRRLDSGIADFNRHANIEHREKALSYFLKFGEIREEKEKEG